MKLPSNFLCYHQSVYDFARTVTCATGSMPFMPFGCHRSIIQDREQLISMCRNLNEEEKRLVDHKLSF